MKERLVRLLVPFVFGLLVLVPPMFYVGFSDSPGFDQSYGAFWLSFLDLRPMLAELPWIYEWSVGGYVVDPAHLWFLYYLLLYSLVLLPVFLVLRGGGSSSGWARSWSVRAPS